MCYTSGNEAIRATKRKTRWWHFYFQNKQQPESDQLSGFLSCTRLAVVPHRNNFEVMHMAQTEPQATETVAEVTIECVDVWPEGAEELGIVRSMPMAERDKIDNSDFAWPDAPDHPKYPITDQAHLDAAAKLLGRAPADKQAAIKGRIEAIAKRKGLKLPDTWTEDAASSKDDTARTAMPEHPMMYVPITRIDDKNWEVEGVATSEAVDSFNTIFSYEASKKAFQKWIERTANVREMHDRKAVGKGVGVRFDDDNKQVFVRLRVSKGAPDTWTKIQEGVLSGLSVGAGKPYTWENTERNGKSYPYLTAYDLAELSIVDNASNPDGHGLSICRADGLTDLIDVTEPEAPSSVTVNVELDGKTIVQAIGVERAGARISSETQTAIHGARDSAIKSGMQMAKTCNCPACTALVTALDPDGDGDVDVPGADKTLDPDQGASTMADRIAEVLLVRISQELHSPITRMQAIAGTFARSHAQEIDLSPLQTSLDAIMTRLETVTTQSSLDEVRSALAEVKGQVEVIAKQPASGGPILNGARPVDKSLITDPRSSYPQAQQDTTIEVLNRLQRMGALDTIEKQVAAAALAAQPTRGRTQ
jgi:hypothetical protein